MVDVHYTNGVIAVKEKSLLGDKLLRLCETTAEDAFRALVESGFGSGAEAASSFDAELLCNAEERALDDFIREYAPSEAIAKYLLLPRDYHNAKALVKAERLKSDAENLLAPDGILAASEIADCIKNGEYAKLGRELGGAVEEALLAEEIEGAEVGAIFEKALFLELSAVCKRHGVLKELLQGRVDRINLLTAYRSTEREFAEKLYLAGGKLKTEQLSRVFEDAEKAAHAFDGTPYAQFSELCREAKEKGLPFTEAERALESYEAEYFRAKRYELERSQPFLYYVFRRRAEIANARVVLVCLNAGLEERDIKKRLRAM